MKEGSVIENREFLYCKKSPYLNLLIFDKEFIFGLNSFLGLLKITV